MAPFDDPVDSTDITKQVRNTRDRRTVDDIHRLSIVGVNAGEVSEELGWDSNSCWYNSKFTHQASGMQWVVYLADHAWSGEVKVLTEPRPPARLTWTPKAT